MSKLVEDLVIEFQSIDEVEDDFECYVVTIKISDDGELTSTESTEAVSQIEIDNENQECLFHAIKDGKAMNVGRTKQVINAIDSSYALGSVSTEESIDDPSIRIGNLIIGFGENIELKQFFVVCEAVENKVVLH